MTPWTRWLYWVREEWLSDMTGRSADFNTDTQRSDSLTLHGSSTHACKHGLNSPWTEGFMGTYWDAVIWHLYLNIFWDFVSSNCKKEWLNTWHWGLMIHSCQLFVPNCLWTEHLFWGHLVNLVNRHLMYFCTILHLNISIKDLYIYNLFLQRWRWSFSLREELVVGMDSMNLLC